MDCDVVVIGLGAHGSAIAAHCAAAGLAVVGLDADDPPHPRGSHHGESRIIRQAYYEHPSYVPLLQRAYAMWDELAAQAGERLIARTGGLMIGPGDGELVPGALQSAREFGLPHEWLAAGALQARHPAFRPAPGAEAVYEPDAGILRPESCVRAFLDRARQRGADLRPRHQVTALGSGAAGVVVEAIDAQGRPHVLRAPHAIVAAGAGLPGLMSSQAHRVQVERQVVAHFEPHRPDDGAALRQLPIFAIEEPDGRFHYGFPDLGTGVKVARHHGGAVSASAQVDDVVRDADVASLRDFLAARLPGANGRLGSAAVCRYTNAADQHFLIDRADPNLLVVSACSGHGFKFAPVIGEIASRLVQGLAPGHDITLFDAARLDVVGA